MGTDHSGGVGGRKPCYDVLMATERKCYDCTQLLWIAEMQIENACAYLREAPHAIPYGTCALVLFHTAGLTYHSANMFACKLRMLNEDLWWEIMYACTGTTKKR